MQIISIQLQNIKSHRDTELSFSPGINVLSGPNGIGKSTIFEAIGYALFGVDAQSFVGNVERFISIGAKKGAIAVVFRPANDELFRVSRTVGTPSKWLLAKEQGGVFEVEEHKDGKETEGRLKTILGLDNGRSLAEQFELVIGPFQNEFLGPFVIKQPARRRDKFDEILGIDTWRKTYKETSTLASAIKSKIEILQSALGPLKDQVAVLPEKRAAQTLARQAHAETTLRVQEQQLVLKQLTEQLVEIDKREQAVKELQVDVSTLKGRIDNGKEKIDHQNALISASEKAQQVVVANEIGKIAFEQAEKQLAGLREQLKLQRFLEAEVAALDKQVGTTAERFTAEVRLIEQAEQELLTEEQALTTRRKGLVVDECLQAQADQLPEVRDALSQLSQLLGQLEGRRVGLEEGKQKLAAGICPFFQEDCLNVAGEATGDVFSGKFSELTVDRQRLEEDLARLKNDEKVASLANDQLKALAIQLKNLEEQLTGLASRKKAIIQRREGVDRLRQDHVDAQQRLSAKQELLQGYSRLQADIELAEAEKQNHKPAYDLYMSNINQAADLAKRSAELQRFTGFLLQLQEDLAQKETDLASLSQEYSADQHQVLRQQKDITAQDVGALGQKVINLDADILRLGAEIETLRLLEEDIKAKKIQIKTYGEKEELVKFLRNRVFRNVSGSLSERFREEISQRADRIYRVIAEVDEELCWGDNYQIVLRDMVAGEMRERVDDQLSGGQIMSSVVALRLALLQTIGARIAFFDEPTSNLDAARRENLANAFRAIDVGREEVTEHWYDQLFLISHDVAFTEVTDQIISLDMA